MQTNLSVTEAISQHRAAVLIDEQSYDGECNMISRELAEATGGVEADAFIVLARAPCATHSDVQAKITYFANEKVGERSLPVECLGHEQYGGFEVFEEFVRSLTLSPATEA